MLINNTTNKIKKLLLEIIKYSFYLLLRKLNYCYKYSKHLLFLLPIVLSFIYFDFFHSLASDFFVLPYIIIFRSYLLALSK